MRTLYDCKNARYPVPPYKFVTCAKGYLLDSKKILARQVDQNDNLVKTDCQSCPDFDDMNDNHKGQFCIYSQNIFCQEGYCSNCYLNPDLTKGCE